MHVIGTAGHVDHGKSSLVRALTGTDPDRWLEEKLRGMTLDLGFARLRYDDGLEAAIVDVPGHERFVHNMLAGAAGVELLVLVVAANEGPRPQTFEHLAILRYLNVRRVVVAFTKSDLLDDGDLEDARAELAGSLAGSVAAGAPIVPVSTITGDGIAELRAALRSALEALPPRPVDAPVYLPIDRVFALGGYGTIVTGTLMQGRIAVGDRLRATGIEREARVRGLHVFGEARDRVEAGARVALNLASIDRADLARGAVIASAQFSTRSTAEVAFTIEPAARDLVRRRTPVRAYVGAAEILGTLVFASAPAADAATIAGTLHLRTPTVIVPGGVFVVRRLSPKTLLGGGTFGSGDASAAAPEGDRAEDDGAEDAAPSFFADPDVAAILLALAKQGTAGATAARLGAIANLREDRATAILSDLVAADRAYLLDRPAGYAPAADVDALVALAAAKLKENESETPWRAGTTSLALARDLGVPEAALVRALGPAVRAGALAHRSGYFTSPEFSPSLSAGQRTFFDELLARDPAHRNIPVPLADAIARIKASKIPGLSNAFDTLVATGAVHKVHDALYRDDQIVELRNALVSALRERKSITPAEYRDLVGSSRKYVVPLLEWFDATGVTLRSGDTRVLRLVRPKTPA